MVALFLLPGLRPPVLLPLAICFVYLVYFPSICRRSPRKPVHNHSTWSERDRRGRVIQESGALRSIPSRAGIALVN
jgi:hypothetical protein